MNKSSLPFIVDAGNTMIYSNESNPLGTNQKDFQILYCTCGHETKFNFKVKRSVVWHDSRTREDDNSIASITCSTCGKIYGEGSDVKLLEPNVDTLVSIQYNVSSDFLCLYKKRIYVKYSLSSKTVKYSEAVDSLSLNNKNLECKFKFDYSSLKDVKYNVSQLGVNMAFNDSIFENSITVDFINLSLLNIFFGYKKELQYSNLEEAFLFLKNNEIFVCDVDKIKNIHFVNEFYNSHIIYEEKDESGNECCYQLQDNGYEEGILEKVNLDVGQYLGNLLDIAKLYVSTFIYGNITTLLLSKKYQFFNSFINSYYIRPSEVYKKNNATYPSKIIEVSINNDETKKEYLKLSNILYNNIRRPEDGKKLLNFYNTGILTKIEIELIFKLYNVDDVYQVMGMFSNKFSNKVLITIKHIRHILKYKFYENYGEEFFSEYIDTLNSIQQIIESKPAALLFLEKNKKTISLSEQEIYDEYLSIKSNKIFEVKNAKQLKRMHDEMSSIHAVFQNAETAHAFKEITKSLHHLDDNIDDVKFIIIDNMKDMYEEHNIMSHCIQTYSKSVVDLSFLAIRVIDLVSNERATIGLNRQNEKFTFNACKGYKNSRPTAFLIDIVKQYFNKHDIALTTGSISDLIPDESQIKKRPDYLSQEEAIKIRLEKQQVVVNN